MSRVTQLYNDCPLLSFAVCAEAREWQSKVCPGNLRHAGRWWQKGHLDRALAVHTPNHTGTLRWPPTPLSAGPYWGYQSTLPWSTWCLEVQGCWNLYKYESWSAPGSWKTSHGVLGQDWKWRSLLTISLREVPEAKMSICIVSFNCLFLP